MSTAPPPPPQQSGYYGPGLPPIPVPHAELIVYVLAIVVLGIIALAAETVDARELVVYGTFLTIGYLLSRGLAKLGKVYESR
jgi:hypothetical protein